MSPTTLPATPDFDRAGWVTCSSASAGVVEWRLAIVVGPGRIGYLETIGGSNLLIDLRDAEEGIAKMKVGAMSIDVMADALARLSRLREFRPPTSVWNVRGMPAEQIASLGIVYCGRPLRKRDGLGSGGVELPGHILANPFRLERGAKKPEREKCVARYREWLREEPDRMTEARNLRGKRLGCWCGFWPGYGAPDFECHCIEIARVAEGL